MCTENLNKFAPCFEIRHLDYILLNKKYSITPGITLLYDPDVVSLEFPSEIEMKSKFFFNSGIRRGITPVSGSYSLQDSDYILDSSSADITLTNTQGREILINSTGLSKVNDFYLADGYYSKSHYINGWKHEIVNKDKNFIYVNSIYDFGPIVGNRIIMQPKRYIIHEDIYIVPPILGFQIDPGVSFEMSGRKSIYYVSQSGNSLFYSQDLAGSLIILSQVNIVSDGTGTLFDISSPTANQVSFFITNICAFAGWFSLGHLRDANIILTLTQFFSSLFGLTFNNNYSVALINIKMTNFFNVGTTFLRFLGNIDNLQLSLAFFQIYNNDKAIYLGYTGPGMINGCIFNDQDLIFESGSRDETDIYLTVQGNTFMKDSTAISQLSSLGNALVTNVAISGNLYQINAVFTDEQKERFINYSSGITEYTGLERINVLASLTVSMRPVVGITISLFSILVRAECDEYAVTIDTVNDLVVVPNSFNNLDRILFSYTTQPSPISNKELYYIRNVTPNNFQISSQPASAILDLTSAGSLVFMRLATVLNSSICANNASFDSEANYTSSNIVQLNTGCQIRAYIGNNDSTSNIVAINSKIGITKI